MIYATRGAIFDGFMAKLHFDIFVYFYFLGSRRREPPRRGHMGQRAKEAIKRILKIISDSPYEGSASKKRIRLRGAKLPKNNIFDF